MTKEIQPASAFLARGIFLRDCRLGLGAMALGNCCCGISPWTAHGTISRSIGQSAPTASNSLPGTSEERHLSVHGGRAEPAGVVRSQAEAAGTRRPGDSRVVRRQQAFRVHQEGREAAGHAPQVRSTWAERPDDLGIAAAFGDGCRRHRDHPLDEDRRLQSRAGQVLSQYRVTNDSVGRAMGAWVTYGIGSEARRSAGVCRLAIGSARSAWRRAELGQRFLADDVSRRSVPHQGRPDSQSANVRPESTLRRQQRLCRRRSTISIDCDSRTPAIREIAHSHRRVRNGVSHANQRAGADGPRRRDAGDARLVRRRGRQAAFRDELPAGSAAGRNAACDSCSSITPTGIITATKERNWANRSTRFARKSINRWPRWCRTSSSAACSTTRW